MVDTFDALERATEAVDQLAAKLAAADHLDWNERCGLEQPDGDDCDSGTCIASYYEDHDPDTARANYRRYARIALVSARDIIVNSPETADFMAGVPIEAAHQRERWASDHDAGKSPYDWFWLIGYLTQKAADAAVHGDTDKAKHHTISTAAALANWHAQLAGASRDMRPGIGPGNGGSDPGSANDLATKLA